ncbi:Transcription initiation factor IIF%2C small subunit (RAP30) [Chlamydia trachomatis]|nr:Transcription initiation factor IIF%2C small subunit (RAP30) [Chlamydia trachomatis]
MPKKDLLDLLFRLFEEYEYWSMKGLKERTRQPESYLKESLESIATLIKRGPYTSKYTLKAEYRRLRDAERAVRLGLDEDDQNKENNEDEDEDEEMEDVV